MSKTVGEFRAALRNMSGAKDENTLKKWIEAFACAIGRELHYDTVCHVPGVGTFTAEEVPERQQAKIINGEVKVVLYPAHLAIRFEPAESLINEVNDDVVGRRTMYNIRKKNLSDKEQAAILKQMARCTMNLPREEIVSSGFDNLSEMIKKIKNGKQKENTNE